MSLVSDIVTQIRVEIDDTDSTRFEDDTTIILPMIKKALRRADHIIIKHGLEFGKSETTCTVPSGAATTAVPTDFKRDIAVYYNYQEIKKLDTHNFETTKYGDYYRINGSNIELVESVDSDTDLILWYYPKTDYSAYTTSSTMPWSGRLDDIIVNYTVLLLRNIDEYDTTVDMALTRELEQMILDVYRPLTATLQERNGWLP